SIGKPVFSDLAYGGRVVRYGSSLPKIKSRIQNLLELMPRQALHAKTLGFVHPHKKEFMKFDSDLPGDMKRLISKLK
ncbi:MAG: RluA family pseudouridine synthase, partial [Ignavibacteriaceae bacterium]